MDYRKIITIEPDKRGGKPCIRGASSFEPVAHPALRIGVNLILFGIAIIS